MSRVPIKSIFVAFALVSLPAMAQEDASMHQVYEAAQSGHLDQAQQMMAKVLADHPNSAKAHYVEAELDAKQGNLGAARAELGTAERLDPGLPFAKPEAVRELRAQLSESSGGGGYVVQHSAPHSGGGLPWGLIIFGLVIGGIIWAIVRNRRANAFRSGSYRPDGFPGGYGPNGYGGGPVQGGGMGSGIVGGLASGLAVGAGVVAGEEIAHRLLDGGRDERRFDDNYSNTREIDEDPNPNMGGSDFGISDSGSWDDDSGGGGGGSDDWS